MNERPPAPGPGMTLGDILYIVFRHKWKIVLVSLLGVAAAFCVPLVKPVEYQSEARLYLRYVLEPRTPNGLGENDSRVRMPELRGESIINTELQILTSLDLAEEVADAVGPEKILGKAKPESRLQAAALIRKKLVAEVPKDSSVIHLAFQHPNPEIVQPVVQELIRAYFKKQAAIHAVGAFDDFLARETDQRRAHLAQTEEALRQAMAKAGVISLADQKQAYSAQITHLQQQIIDGESDLAEHRATLEQTAKALHVASPGSAAVILTNASGPVPDDKRNEYRNTCLLAETLSRKQQDLLTWLTPTSPMVLAVKQQIANNQKTKKDLETQYPGLLEPAGSATNNIAGDTAPDPLAPLRLEQVRVSGIEARVKTLKEQLDKVRKAAAALDESEGHITELERQLQLERTNYTRFAQSLEQSQLDAKLGAGKVSNISTIQEPTPPLRASSKLRKMMAMVALGGIAAAFALAFLLELYLDQSIKRPAEVEAQLGLPLFMSIPLLNGHGKPRRLGGKSLPLLPSGSDASAIHPQRSGSLSASGGEGGGEVAPLPQPSALSPQHSAPWHPLHPLRPFAEALRDRMIAFFEFKNMTHKPKLVAVTSCGQGAGVSSVAAGVAASLSETGEGNVLLVDMNLENGGSAHFHRGDLACGLDDALELEKRDQAQVQDKLYMVSEGKSDKLPAALPRRFQNLVPRLKASDYDYIIFDMPPVSQISITPRLARFMDFVLMVVESEQTDKELVKRASGLLAQSKTNVGVVLNKTRSYVPKSLAKDL